MKTAWGLGEARKVEQEEWKYFDDLGAGGYNAPGDMTT
jgi:hypothetical protein